MKRTLWTENYCLIIGASAIGNIGGIAGSYALGLLVFDETGSTLASALILAVQLIPGFLVPLAAAPLMDRLPRKPFLVYGDLVNALLYAAAGIFLLTHHFSYTGYLLYSLLLSSLGTIDELAYSSFYPKLIPAGFEEKGYTVSSMLYPVMKVIMTPAAAVLYAVMGVGWILIMQAVCSLAACLIENRIQIREETAMHHNCFSFHTWAEDIREAVSYLKKEKGLRSLYAYMAVTNGIASGYAPIMVAYFRTAPGLSMVMYSFFSAAEFIGRTIGGAVQYRLEIPPKKKFAFCISVYFLYDFMDLILLWIPYPLMLLNRAAAGFLGINSAAMREAAVQRYLPERMRARINAFQNMSIMASSSFFVLLLGAAGEVMDLRICMSVSALSAIAVCTATVLRNHRHVRRIFLSGREN